MPTLCDFQPRLPLHFRQNFGANPSSLNEFILAFRCDMCVMVR